MIEIIRFYIGCKMIVKDGSGNFEDVLYNAYPDDNTVWGLESECVPLKCIKLILKNPAVIKKDAKSEYRNLCKQVRVGNKIYNMDTPQSIAWGILNHYDMFDLKIKGYATYRKTNQQPNKPKQS